MDGAFQTLSTVHSFDWIGLLKNEKGESRGGLLSPVFSSATQLVFADGNGRWCRPVRAPGQPGK